MKKPLSLEEFKKQRRPLRNVNQEVAARMSRLGGSLLHNLPILSVDDVIERIDAVGMPDLRELASELFTAESLSVAGVGPDEHAFEAAIGPLSEGVKEPAH